MMELLNSHYKRETMKNEILAIGPVTKDIIITPYDKYYQIGGAVYYQTCTLHQLKNHVTSIITIGENDQKIIEEFPNKKSVKKIITQQTMEYINIYSENLTRTQKAILPHNPITPTQIKKTNIHLPKYNTAIISPLSKYDIPPETITYLKKNNINTVLVAQGYIRSTDKNNNILQTKWQNKEKYLKDTDILILDEDEMKIAFNTDINDETIHNILLKYHLKTIIITKAEKGSDIYTRKEKVKIPAIKTTKNVDPTGLGDTYISAYISKKLEKKSIYESGLFAAITTKYKLENKGPIKTDKKIIEKELENRLNQIS